MDISTRIKQFSSIDIYPVISSEYTNNRPVLDVLKAIGDGGAKIVQLREKNISKYNLYKLAEQYRKITETYNMLLIINDHLDVASAVGADGVHLGQDDLPLPAARRIAPNLILGSSTHNMTELLEAQEMGADYINIGPINSTQTKEVGYESLGIDGLKKVIPACKIPFTVMGGIKANDIPSLIMIGATKIAMVTEITMAEDIASRVKSLRMLWEEQL